MITIDLLDDTLAEGDDSFGISLGPPAGGATRGENATTTVMIREDDMAVPPLARISRAANGQYHLQSSGTPGTNYRVLASLSLSDWELIGTAAEVSPGTFEFFDPAWFHPPCRLYRLRWP